MKNKIVIKEKTFKDFLLKHKDNHEICSFSPLVIMSRCSVEQVPETYEELKELVDKYSGKINRQVGGITVGTTRIIIMMKFDNIYFGKNGNIYFADKFLGTYTPTRQWQIIKSLIGE